VSIKDEKAADLAAILAEVGETVIWNGKPYPALVSDPTVGEHLELGGFVGTGDFTIKIPRAAFSGGLPKLGDVVEFEGERYRVTRITNHPQYPMIVLVVGPAE